MKRNIIVFSTILVVIIAISCKKGSSIDVNCAECYNYEPDSAELSVDLSITAGVYDSVYLEFFEGNVESGKPSWEGEVFTPRFYHLVPVDKYYSVKATYRDKGKTVIAIDGSKMVSRYISDACDGDCWIVKGNILDVELKY